MLLIGKPSISIRAIYTMAMLVITRGYHEKPGCSKHPRYVWGATLGRSRTYNGLELKVEPASLAMGIFGNNGIYLSTTKTIVGYNGLFETNGHL